MELTKKDNFIAYSAEVKLSIMKKDKTLKTRTFKNSGRWPMFYFLACCLAGNFNAALTHLPKYVDLFHAGDVGSAVPVIGSDDPLHNYAKSETRRTLVTYTYTTAPEPDHNESIIGDASVSYKFMIPFTHINTADDINLLCLYDDFAIKQRVPLYSEPAAFFFIKNEEGKLGALLSRDDIIAGEANDYNVFIEWTINIENKGE